MSYDLFVSYRSDNNRTPGIPALKTIVNLLKERGRVRLFADWIEFPDRAPENGDRCIKAAAQSRCLLRLRDILEDDTTPYTSGEVIAFRRAKVHRGTRLILRPDRLASSGGEIMVAPLDGVPHGKSPNDLSHRYDNAAMAVEIIERLVLVELPSMDL